MSAHSKPKTKGLTRHKAEAIEKALLAEALAIMGDKAPAHGYFYRAVRILAMRNPMLRQFVGLPPARQTSRKHPHPQGLIPERSLFGYVTMHLPEHQGGGDRYRDQLAMDYVKAYDAKVRNEAAEKARQMAADNRKARRAAERLERAAAPVGRQVKSPVALAIEAGKRAAAARRYRAMMETGVAPPPANPTGQVLDRSNHEENDNGQD